MSYRDLIYDYVQVKHYSSFDELTKDERTSILRQIAFDDYQKLIPQLDKFEQELFFKYTGDLRLTSEPLTDDEKADIEWFIRHRYIGAIEHYFNEFFYQLFPAELRSFAWHYADPIASDRKELVNELRS